MNDLGIMQRKIKRGVVELRKSVPFSAKWAEKNGKKWREKQVFHENCVKTLLKLRKLSSARNMLDLREYRKLESVEKSALTAQQKGSLFAYRVMLGKVSSKRKVVDVYPVVKKSLGKFFEEEYDNVNYAFESELAKHRELRKKAVIKRVFYEELLLAKSAKAKARMLLTSAARQFKKADL